MGRIVEPVTGQAKFFSSIAQFRRRSREGTADVGIAWSSPD